MPGKGTDEISSSSIKQIKHKLKTVYVEKDRKELLEKWNKKTAAKLENGLWSDEQMMVVQSYFTDQIMTNSNRMKKYKTSLQQNKKGLRVEQYLEEMDQVSKIEEVFNKKTWAEYQKVENRNRKKKAQLKKLSQVTCKIAGRNWSPECDKLLNFMAAH